MGEIVEVKNFATEVLDNKGKVLVVCSAVWCGPCKAMSALLKNAMPNLNSLGLSCMKLDTDSNTAVCASLNIKSIPTLFLYEGGKQIKKHSGLFRSEKDLISWITDLDS